MRSRRIVTTGPLVLFATPLLRPRPSPAVCAGPAARVTTFATGFDNPHGMKFGSDGFLYVAEAGTGGNHTPADGLHRTLLVL